jgi:hypothetical protein
MAAGLVAVAAFWWLNWQSHRIGPVTIWAFFPLWLGYILTVDGLTAARHGTSLFARDRRRFGALFLYSVPVWWLFEYLNRFLGNWEYLGATLPRFQYMAFASLSFSTVIPAVFVSAELLSRELPAGLGRARAVELGPRSLALCAVIGAVLFGLITVRPDIFYPAAWLCVILMVDPIVTLAGWPSLARSIGSGNWRLPVSLALGALLCGFFWEMWNVHSWPKWVYHIPYLGFGKIFEMPVLGYGGYLPFGLEVYALYRLFSGIADPHAAGAVTVGDR